MTQVGYALSSEEHDPIKIVDLAKEAETHKFPFALISDHFHPWLHKQGNSPFVWSSLGAIAQHTNSLRIGTGVTAPIMRIHPVIIAQAAATIGYLMKERFFLGLGTGEFLNEHVTSEGWPPYEVRMEMCKEAVEIILYFGRVVQKVIMVRSILLIMLEFIPYLNNYHLFT